ncbi:hypothetical protein JCM6882_002518 [Rhodosporidiobolus microsporus]
MPQLLNDEFLAQLADLFASKKDKGSVFVTQKRFTYTPEAGPSTSSSTPAAAAGEDVAMEDAGAAPEEEEGNEAREWPLLVRATEANGGKDSKKSKVNLSTVVPPFSYDTFTTAYHALLRTVFSAGLRPKRKRAAAAKEAKKLAKRKARSGTPGPAVGAGEGAAAGAEQPAEAPASQQKVGFTPRLPKVIGPRRGNGVKKRRRAEKRRERAVERVKAAKGRRAVAAE